MIHEHDRVVLTTDIAAERLTAGDVGTVVHVYADEKAFEVEFVTLSGETAAVVTVDANHVRAVRAGEIPHARPLSAA
jgi:hypothetical protein